MILTKDHNHHPAHSPLTSRRLHQMRDILSKASAQRDGGDIGYAMSDAVKLIDEVLAVRDAKPVGEFYETSPGNLYQRSDGDKAPQWTPLYAVPQPAPVVPEVLPCPVLLEPGMRFGKGVRTQTMLDALQHRAEHHAELEAMTPEQRAEHEAGIAEFKSMLGAPAPVVQDDGRDQFEEWMLKKWGRERQEYDFVMGKFLHGENYADSYTRHMWKAWTASRAAMLSAAPQQDNSATSSSIDKA